MSDVIGVDVGGTKIAAARLSGRQVGDRVPHASHSDLELTGAATVPTDLSGSDQLLEQIVAAVQKCRGPELDGVGVGVPSAVDFKSGRIVNSANIPLADVPVREVLAQRLGVPVFVDNDATVAALAEAHDDEMVMVARDLVMITIGTGIGSGLVLGGRIYRGATGAAGELGHAIIGMDLSGPVPDAGKFPQRGSFEGVAAGHALDRLAAQCAAEHPASALGMLAAGGETVHGADAVKAARDGDAEAERVIELWGERVGIGIANAINTFDPEEVVIGGGAAQAGELMLAPARRTAAAYVMPGVGRRTTIRLARHGVQAGVLGAALLAIHELADAPPPSPTEPAGAVGSAGASR
jgi:glucokinase